MDKIDLFRSKNVKISKLSKDSSSLGFMYNSMSIQKTFAEKYEVDANKYVGVSLRLLPFPVRAMNCFRKRDWNTLTDLLNQNSDSLRALRGLGTDTEKMVEMVLEDYLTGKDIPEIFPMNDQVVPSSDFNKRIDYDEFSCQTFAEKYEVDASKYMGVSLRLLPFPVRAMNCFEAQNWSTLSDLLKKSDISLMLLKNIGRGTVDKINEVLRNFFEENGNITVPQNNNIVLNYNQCFEEIYGVKIEDYKNKRIDLLGLSVRAINALKRIDCSYVSDLLRLSINDIKRIKNIGIKTVQEISAQLDDFLSTKLEKNEISGESLFKLFEGLSLEIKIKKIRPFIDAFLLKYNTHEDSILRSINSVITVQHFCNSCMDNITDDKLEDLYAFFTWLSVEENTLQEVVVDSLFAGIKERNRIIFLERCRCDDKGRRKTLDLVAEVIATTYGGPKLNRERIRQIEGKVLGRINQNYHRLGYDIILWTSAQKNGKLEINRDDICDIFGELVADVVMYCWGNGKITGECGYYCFEDVFFIGDDSREFKDAISRIDKLPEILEAKEFYRILDECECNIQKRKNWFKDYIMGKYTHYGVFYSKKQLPTEFRREYILKNFYKDGYKIASVECARSFRKHEQEVFGIYDDANDRVLDQAICKMGVLWNRGLYIHKDLAKCDHSFVGKLVKYIENSRHKVFTYQELYNVFSVDLELTGIHNRYALQGVLMRDLDRGKYFFYRDYISKEKNANKYSDFEAYVQEHGYVSEKEVLLQFPAYSRFSWVYNLKNIIYIGNGRLMHGSAIKIDDQERETILSYIMTLCATHPITSSYLYQRMHVLYSSFMDNNRIYDDEQLFRVLQYLYSDKLVFSQPFISKDEGRMSTIRALLQYIDKEECVQIEYVLDLCRKHKINLISTWTLIEGLRKYYVRVDHDNLYRRDSLNLDDSTVAQVVMCVREHLDKNGEYIAIGNIDDYEHFPDIGFEWNGYLLEAILKIADDSPELVYNSLGYTWHDVCTVVVGNKFSKTESSEQLIIKILMQAQKDGEVFIDEQDMLEWLKEKKLCGQNKFPDFLKRYIKREQNGILTVCDKEIDIL